jgi:membrane-associated phospholipid phosphatase
MAYLLGVAWMFPRIYRPLTFGIAATGAAVINVLRVREREHWPTDVIAGDIIGAVSMMGAHFALDRISRRPVGRTGPRTS